MSDALLKEISEKLTKLTDVVSKGGAVGGAVTKPAATGGAPNKAATDKAAADKAAAKKAADEKAAAAAAAAAAAKAKTGTKAPGGKHTIDQVREIIRKVAADVDKQSAKDILKDDGNGAEKVLDLKPEFYDAVFEACEVLLGGEGKKEEAAATDADDDFA